MEKKNIYIKDVDYFKKRTGYDKVYLNASIVDLNTKKFTKEIINLGRSLFDEIDFNMKNKFFNYLKNDILVQDIQYYDYQNKLVIEKKIKEKFEDWNMIPYIDNNINIYQFASIAIRIYLMKKANDFVDNQTSDFQSKIIKNIEDKNKLNKNKYLYIFNDYYLEDLSEPNKTNFICGNYDINYDVKFSKIKEYVFRLYNDLNMKYNLIQFSSKVYFDRSSKQGKIFTYHQTPISSVYKYLGESFCNNDGKIIQCQECGYYLEVTNSNTHYHDECYFERERRRKRNAYIEKNKNDRT